MYTPNTALAAGMIDKVAAMEEVEQCARDEIQKWLKIPGKNNIA